MITRNSDSVQGVDRTWQRELAEAYRSPAQLLTALDLDPAQFGDGLNARRLFPMLVPKPFAAAMVPGDPADPLLRQVLPIGDEFADVPGFGPDPIGEQDGPLPGLLHKYRSRVLLMLRTGCAVNCRYCFRRHFPYADHRVGQAELEQARQYIAADTNINELLLSGGDPLMARDDHLAALFEQFRDLPHLKRLRIHSRLPVVLPSRVTDQLVTLLSSLPWQVVLVLHINHPNELQPELVAGLARLKAAGVTLLNQAVLLKGVNDNADTLVALSETLFEAGVLPYYLHLLDRVQGAAHFEVSEDEARSLMAAQLDRLPGFLVPRLVREIAGQPSKTPIDLKLV
ncbi:EF-P beta-lysylation protein EpmB [Ferrimonas balearica]|uniref:EF-P beta-lysylation protein EpmB n=1 Tax=Ferrimonas balearica TaxID=44012 RepID=UPI001C9A15DB|nr:EF-P beta-lysylation protein EpmB [Ferrimonas balearica]MBY5923083.1 EF-P beta-lysylation protein EpmB [Ferrimonas balearica]MBY5997541.1 EF-P beta-lysylation protein EpmB [Ferrimonas balearica]